MNNSELAEAAFTRASAALQLRRPQQALAAAGQGVALDPANDRGFGILCCALLGLERCAEAQKAAEDGLALAPESEWLHRLRFWTLYGQARFPEALAAADQAVTCAPEVGGSHYCRSLALDKLGRFADAVAAVTQALAIDAQDADFHQHLGTMHLHRNPEVAEEHLRRAAGIDPTNATLLNDLGVALHRQKKDKAAMAAFKAAVLLDPRLKEAKKNLFMTVQQYIKFGSSIILLFVLQVVLRSAIKHEEWKSARDAIPRPWAWLVGGALLLIFIIGVLKWWLYPFMRNCQLKQEDPQLLQIYKKLGQDQKAKRL